MRLVWIGSPSTVAYLERLVDVVPRLDLVIVTSTYWGGLSQDIGSSALTRMVLDLVIEEVLPAVR